VSYESAIVYKPLLNMIRSPDCDPTGFCTSEPDPVGLDFEKTQPDQIWISKFLCVSVCDPVVFAHFQCGIDPRTSGSMDYDVIDVNSALDESAKESSCFHMHGSHL